jgi:hypothetical protein
MELKCHLRVAGADVATFAVAHEQEVRIEYHFKPLKDERDVLHRLFASPRPRNNVEWVLRKKVLVCSVVTHAGRPLG